MSNQLTTSIITPVQRPIEEEKKEPEPSQSVQRSDDPIQATLRAFGSILAQRLGEQKELFRGQIEQLEQKLEEKFKVQKEQL